MKDSILSNELPLEIENIDHYPWNLFTCQPIVKHEYSYYHHSISEWKFYLLQEKEFKIDDKIRFQRCKFRKFKKVKHRRRTYIIKPQTYFPNFYYSVLRLGNINRYLFFL